MDKQRSLQGVQSLVPGPKSGDNSHKPYASSPLGLGVLPRAHDMQIKGRTHRLAIAPTHVHPRNL